MANKASLPLPDGYQTLTALSQTHSYVDPHMVKEAINDSHSSLHKHARLRTREEQPAGVLGYIIDKKAFDHWVKPLREKHKKEVAERSALKEAKKKAKEEAARVESAKD